MAHAKYPIALPPLMLSLLPLLASLNRCSFLLRCRYFSG